MFDLYLAMVVTCIAKYLSSRWFEISRERRDKKMSDPDAHMLPNQHTSNTPHQYTLDGRDAATYTPGSRCIANISYDVGRVRRKTVSSDPCGSPHPTPTPSSDMGWPSREEPAGEGTRFFFLSVTGVSSGNMILLQRLRQRLTRCTCWTSFAKVLNIIREIASLNFTR